MEITELSLLAVDPGIALGWAYWPKNRKYPTRCGIIKPHNRSKDFFLDTHSTIHQLSNVILELKPGIIACEWPAHFSSAGGEVAAGSGSIVKLAFNVGQIALAADACECEFFPIAVNKWKGNLKKRIVEKRIRKILPESRLEYLEPESHTWDAIGIGLYVRGLF